MISFGKIIPLATCQVLNSDELKHEDATVCMIDCKDYGDFQVIDKDKEAWAFKKYIRGQMSQKFAQYHAFHEDNCNDFFIVKNNDGDMLAIAETKHDDDCMSIEYLESRRDKKYKYAGSALVATIAALVINNHKMALGISAPIPSAIPFYINKCGFSYYNDSFLLMKRKQMKCFINQMKQKIGLFFLNT